MFVLAVLLAIFACLLISYLWVLKSRYNYFILRHIPGPPPRFFFGHYLTLWNTPSVCDQIQEWARQYGSIYGLFEGTRPMYVVSDIDFLQEVFIKQFSMFHSRRTNFLSNLLSSKGAHLFNAHASQWRRQRHVINPTFTTVKLKTMTPLMNKCIESMLVKVDEMNGEEFNIYTLYQRLTMDVIWHCAFGIDTDMQNDVDNTYMKKSIACFSVDPEKFPLVKLSNVMPFLIPVLNYVVKIRVLIINLLNRMMPSIVPDAASMARYWIIDQVKDVVKNRLTSGKKRMDLLQLMLDAATNGEIKDDDEEDESKLKHLNYTEVVMNVFLFMVGGFQSTSTALGYSTYILAKHPEVQVKLRSEIDEHWKEGDEEINYEIVSDMTYMDYFIREVLRMYRVSGQNSTRLCNQSTTVCGHQIDEGSVILPDVYSVHFNPDLWGPEDPKLFIPERHAVKRHPIAYMGFGVGPRYCVGMRFALMTLKMALACLLHIYNILPGENIEKGMNRQETSVIKPEAIYIRLEKRSN